MVFISVSGKMQSTGRYFNIYVYLKFWHVQLFSKIVKFEYLYMGQISSLSEMIMYHQIVLEKFFPETRKNQKQFS